MTSEKREQRFHTDDVSLPGSYPHVSLSIKMWTQRKAGRRQRATLPIVSCGSSPVTRFALASTMRKTKRLRRKLVHYLDLGSAYDWLKQISIAAWPIRSTDWTSFGGVTSGDVGKCQMLSQATDVINWGGAWWDWFELHYGIVLGDKSVPEQKHIINFMKRAFLLSTTFFSKYSDSYDEPWLISTNHHFESNFSSSMQKIRIQFSILKQPRESHCKNENSQSSPGCNSMQHRPALTRAT